jgi:hypothetical protein
MSKILSFQTVFSSLRSTILRKMRRYISGLSLYRILLYLASVARYLLTIKTTAKGNCWLARYVCIVQEVTFRRTAYSKGFHNESCNDAKLSVNNLAPISHVCMSAILLLLIVVN